MAAQAQLLSEHGCDVRLYQRDSREFHRLDARKRFQALTDVVSFRRTHEETARLVRDWRPDVAHVHNVFPLITPLPTAL